MTCSYLASLFKQLLPYCPDISRELVIIRTCLLRPIVWSCNIKLHFYSLWDQHYSALLFCLESSGRKNTSSKKLTSFNEKTSNTKNVRERKKWIWYLSKPLNKNMCIALHWDSQSFKVSEIPDVTQILSQVH